MSEHFRDADGNVRCAAEYRSDESEFPPLECLPNVFALRCPHSLDPLRYEQVVDRKR